MFGLPEYLSERCIQANDNPSIGQSGPVIVWLKSSFRTEENPAIDAARIIANRLDLPLFIYHGIDERYPHASLRHHNMLLDASVDMHHGCTKIGVDYYLHIARDGHRQSVMKELSKQASLIITDLFPLPPWNDWVKHVADIATCPVLEIDCHCVVPMPVFGKSVDRPFKYRDATKRLRKTRLNQLWPKLEIQNTSWEGPLPFNPVDIDTEIKPMKQRFNLLKKCNIDATVLPVWNENGGQYAALSRWDEFKQSGLSGYARRRNKSEDPNGVSRLSAAIHYGTISVMKIARESASFGTKSADKFLDELLIFREHAWHHCYSSTDPYGSHNLPQWARESWKDTENDVRTIVLDKNQFEFSQSPSPLWNLCQTSLYRHGELHNNLRMTWGKATPLWTKSLEESLEMGQHLNDKYALDGRDPSSIAGVQWCHGLFDRAFYPPLPVMGVVRKRDIETHKSRMDLSRYENHVQRKPSEQFHPFIIIGAGYSGAYAAYLLKSYGYDVVVLDKGTIPGGRSSTKTRSEGIYNHGNGEIWNPVHSSGNTISRNADQQIHQWLEGIEVVCETRVTRIIHQDQCVHVEDENGTVWKSDALIMTCPIPQCYELMSSELPKEWATHPYKSSWTLILTHTNPAPISLLNIDNPSIENIRRGIKDNSSNHIIVQMGTLWSDKFLEESRDEITERILKELETTVDSESLEWISTANIHAHRWRLARPKQTPKTVNIERISFAGDAWSEPLGTIEAAVNSAKWAVAELLWNLNSKPTTKSVAYQTKLF
ncbi:MAG: NAD(P)-binding protein [Euryarchaeota archaeon]|nr:NAD(P)-binding protein [Euryarchaeota archaeon]